MNALHQIAEHNVRAVPSSGIVPGFMNEAQKSALLLSRFEAPVIVTRNGTSYTAQKLPLGYIVRHQSGRLVGENTKLFGVVLAAVLAAN